MTVLSAKAMSEQVARVRSILDGIELPSFVAGYDLRTGEFNDEPAIWITFRISDNAPPRLPFPRDRLDAMNRLTDTVLQAVLRDEDAPYPFFRFTEGVAHPSP